MGIFSDIFSKIKNFAHEAEKPVQYKSDSASPTPNKAPPQQASSSESQPVDVEATLKALASQSSMKLDYQHSIVDLMKLLNLDSSLDSRRKLADELNYTGDKSDTGAMNVWLIKQLYGKIGENGGHVPQDWKL